MSSSSSSSSSSSTSTSTSSSQSRSQAAPAPEPTVTSRRRRNGKEKANGNGEGSSKHILKPVPFMSVLTEDQTDYFDLDDNLFESMNMGANGIRLGANEADEDAEEIEAAGDDTTSLTYLQASRANTTTRTLARRTRKLPEPFTGQDTEEGHQVILEMKMHRLEGESPELFNIRVQMAEKKAGLRAKKTELTETEEADIERELSELRAVLNAKSARDSQLAKGTVTSYVRYQDHWRKWCERKGYRRTNINKVGGEEVDDRVEYNRYVLYLTEGLQEHATDGGGDERQAVIPFFAKKKRPVEVIEEGEGKRKKRKVVYEDYQDIPSMKTVEAYICAVVDLYTKQQTSEPDGLRFEPHPRTGTAVAAVINAFKHRIAGDPKIECKKYATIDAADGSEVKKMRRLMRVGWAHRYGDINSRRHKITGLKNRLMASWGHHMMMRGENLRFAKLPHINLHTFSNLATPSTVKDSDRPGTIAIVLIMTQGKTMKTGGVTYGVAIRNTDVELCPLGALAFYLFQLWEDPFNRPEFDNEQDSRWRDTYLVFGKNKENKMSNTAHLGGMSLLFKQAGNVTDQPTHFYRHSGAKHAYSLGQDVKAIEHHGGWKKDQGRLTSHYLHPLPKGVAYALAGSTHVGMPPFIKRDVLRPPLALQQKVFPFLEDCYNRHPDWLMLLENIMEDRDEFFNRLTSERMPAPTNLDGILRLKFLRLLAYLRKILIQDAVALMDINPDDYMAYGSHEVFENAIFHDVLFLEYRANLLNAMDLVVASQSDLLSHNAPAIHAELRSLDSKLTNGFSNTRTEMRTFTREVKTTLDISLQHLDKIITTKVENTILQHMEILKGFYTDALNQHSLALNRTIQRMYQDTPLQFLSIYQDEMKRASRPYTQGFPSNRSHRSRQRHRGGAHERKQQDQMKPEVRMVETESESESEFESASEVEVEVEVEVEDQVMEPIAQLQQLQQHPGNRPDSSSPPVPEPELALEPTPEPTPEPAPAPQELLQRMDELALELGSKYDFLFDVDDGVRYEMIPKSRSLRDHWCEWFRGMDGNPSIWRLNGVKGRSVFGLNGKAAATQWRWDPSFPCKRNTYDAQWKFKKDIVYMVLEVMLAFDSDIDLAVREEKALVQIEKAKGSMTLNAFINKHKVSRKSVAQ